LQTVTAAPFNQRTIDEFHAKKGRGVGAWGDHLLLLTATGAKSWQPITTPLVYRREGDSYVVVASKGGAPQSPAWLSNLKANPEVEVEVAMDGGTEKFKARASIIEGGPERDRLYVEQATVWPPFTEYAKRTARVIPVVVLGRSRQAGRR
jgi:deazaflavin-dependent oxidoreductase (nitroreductase family)